MKENFRAQARTALTRGQKELEDSNEDRLKYAALELRMALEALTYDRVQAYKNEIPPEMYETWQPKKVMEMLLGIDPNADMGGRVSIGEEDIPGIPAKEMNVLGTEKVLSLKSIKTYYDAIGSYLHIPTIDQFKKGFQPDPEKLRRKCEEICSVIEGVLSSSVFNVVLGNFVEIECMRCQEKIKKRMAQDVKNMEAICFGCGAEYTVTETGPNKVLWSPIQNQINCLTEGCDTKMWVWRSDIKIGKCWTCEGCGNSFIIKLGCFRDDNNLPKQN